jgi:hypothetical protein
MKTPTFEKFLGDKKVFHPELKNSVLYLMQRLKQSRAELGGQINLFVHLQKKR